MIDTILTGFAVLCTVMLMVILLVAFFVTLYVFGECCKEFLTPTRYGNFDSYGNPHTGPFRSNWINDEEDRVENMS